MNGYYLGCYRRSDLICVIDSEDPGGQELLWTGGGSSYRHTHLYLIMPDKFCRRWAKPCQTKCESLSHPFKGSRTPHCRHSKNEPYTLANFRWEIVKNCFCQNGNR